MRGEKEMRSCMCWREKIRRAFLSQSGQFFCFLTGGLYLQIWGLF